MSVKTEVENYVHENWTNDIVGKWVIKNLPLLEMAYTHPPCPIYSLSLENGLELKNEVATDMEFMNSPKIVISGGFEGTKGHLIAIANIHEVRAITAADSSLVTLMLEQDSYIINRKKRTPIVNIDQRKALWSTSGLVDAVIVLPEQSNVENSSAHFAKVNELIQPATWCANIENEYWIEIITRGESNDDIEAVRITDFESYLHTSFLASTKDLKPEDLKKELYLYILNLVKKTETPQVLSFTSPDEITRMIFQILSYGL